MAKSNPLHLEVVSWIVHYCWQNQAATPFDSRQKRNAAMDLIRWEREGDPAAV